VEAVQTIALSMGLAWASGINLYAAVFMLGVLQHSGHVTLPAELEVVADPLVMFAAGLMYVIEFVADKVPGVDSGWDALHTFVRIPAGAVLAARALGDVSPAAELAAGLLGGAFAASSHALKAGTVWMTQTYKNLKFNEPMDDALFTYTPAEGVMVMDMTEMMDAR